MPNVPLAFRASLRRLALGLALSLLSLAGFAASAASASPHRANLAGTGPEPTLGGWKGQTAQGLPIYFGVREGGIVTNVRVNYRDAICGRATIHKRNLRLGIDEGGRFAGVVYPANGGVEIEGTFIGPRRVTGTIVAGEASGLPGCAGGSFTFSAAPKP